MILYIKGEQNVEVCKRKVTLEDVITMECAEKNIMNRIKKLNILEIPDSGKHRYVISILKIIEMIHKQFPDLEVCNLGEADIIVCYEDQKQERNARKYIKVVSVVAITFCGAAFSIMTFNNDVNVTKIFSQIYRQVMGTESDGFTILEATYSIGLALGILIFFNHFGKKRFSVDPTPIEVEMRLYEKDIQTTVIEDYSRKGQEDDVH